MPRNISASVLTQLASSSVTLGYLVDVGFTGITLYYTTRNFDVTWDSNEYLGSGLIFPIDSFSESSELMPTGITLTLAGTETLISAILQSVDPKVESIVRLAFFDASNAIIGDPYELFRGYVDVPTINDQGDERTVSIVLENDLVRLHHIPAVRYSTNEQRLRFPGTVDLGFEHLPAVSDSPIVWGKVRKRRRRKRKREEDKSEML